jgi:hypothetical protein
MDAHWVDCHQRPLQQWALSCLYCGGGLALEVRTEQHNYELRSSFKLATTHEATRAIACTINGTSSPHPALLSDSPPEKLSTEATSPRGKLACPSRHGDKHAISEEIHVRYARVLRTLSDLSSEHRSIRIEPGDLHSDPQATIIVSADACRPAITYIIPC